MAVGTRLANGVKEGVISIEDREEYIFSNEELLSMDKDQFFSEHSAEKR